ncbi:hypothetical protein CFI10_17645 [Marinobacterium iners]|uniref:hypothetical protein n=1 Tax=Marinobacterium iners TaxID=48076 RepID=UPI001A8D6442|nr:hypothetical protein [Marinobacterium iners]QSR36765.1 hypothetical protein CFI10_17645 [Marinobacterium iners]
MFRFPSEPLSEHNLVEQLEMLGGLLVQQGDVLQFSLLDHHFALTRIEQPGALVRWLEKAADTAPDLRTLYIELPAGERASTAPPTRFEHCRVSGVEAAFDRHRMAAGALECDRVLISLALQDSSATLVCEYIV